MTDQDAHPKHAVLYRMALPDHTCPYGVAARDMLIEAGYSVEDIVLKTREAVDAYKAEQGVETTPQAFIDGQRIGGAEALNQWLIDEHP